MRKFLRDEEIGKVKTMPSRILEGVRDVMFFLNKKKLPHYLQNHFFFSGWKNIEEKKKGNIQKQTKRKKNNH